MCTSTSLHKHFKYMVTTICTLKAPRRINQLNEKEMFSFPKKYNCDDDRE